MIHLVAKKADSKKMTIKTLHFLFLLILKQQQQLIDRPKLFLCTVEVPITWQPHINLSFLFP